MCYSASASFIAGAGLLTASACIFKYKKVNNNEKLVALLPALFAIQQVSEGLVWLGIDGILPHWFQLQATYIFGIFAISIWPVYFSLSMFYFERSNSLKKILSVLLIVGTVVSLLGLIFIITFDADAYVSCENLKCSPIIYNYQAKEIYFTKNFVSNILENDFFGFANTLLILLYDICVLLPFFITKNKSLRYCFAPVLLFSVPVSNLITRNVGEFPSVWCFCAAILSCLVIFAFAKKQNFQVNTV